MPVYDVSEYITWNIPRPIFYVDQILPQGGSLVLYGDPKVKKSWLVQHMAFNISIGEEWLGFRTHQARVLICQFEISSFSYHWRLRDMARNYALQRQQLYIITKPRTYFIHEEVFNRFLSEVREAEINPQVIILDCMSACYGGSENNDEQMSTFIERVTRFRDTVGTPDAAIILVHHANKNILNPSTVGRLRGWSGLAGWTDTLMYMVQQPSGVQLQMDGRQATHELRNINVQFSGYNWSVRGQGGVDGQAN